VNHQTDQQLLDAFAGTRSEAAFTELVERHVNLVYSAALRMVCDAHLAEDVTQGVFVALAQNAARLTHRPVLAGWLHRTAQNLAANTVRSEVRRRAREQEAATMHELLAPDPEASWEELAPHLDAALGELNEADRDALLLRYFEKKSAPEIAAILGISQEAAQKRVTRATDRLRQDFAKRGVAAGAAGLAVLISANAVQSAPAGLAVTISTAALAGSAVSSSVIVTATKIIAMTTLQKTLVTAAIAILAGAGIYEARQAAQLRRQVQTTAASADLAAQLSQVQHERDDATNRIAALTAELAAAKKNPAEVLKLRGEVGALRQEKAIAGNTSALNKITADPATRKSLREQQKIAMSAIYSDLAKSLKLSPDQTAKFNDLIADHVMSSVDLITQALHDHLGRADVDQLFAGADATLQNQLQDLIGADGLARYQDYTQNLLSTLTAAQFAGSLSGDPDAVAEKKSQLMQAMQQAAQSALTSAGLPANYQTIPMLNFANIASPDEGDQSLQLMDSIYAQTAAQASAFLSADELGKFQQFRTNAITSTQSQLLMNRKLMAPIAQ
jgi:RNA polymerase sigma factor (sigma-70 family)